MAECLRNDGLIVCSSHVSVGGSQAPFAPWPLRLCAGAVSLTEQATRHRLIRRRQGQGSPGLAPAKTSGLVMAARIAAGNGHKSFAIRNACETFALVYVCGTFALIYVSGSFAADHACENFATSYACENCAAALNQSL